MSHKNLINGEWLAGAPAANVNPSDVSDVVGEFDRADLAQATDAVAATRAAAIEFYTTVKTHYVNPGQV